MKKDLLPNLIKGVTTVKDQATKAGQDAAKTVTNLRKAVKKAGDTFNKRGLGQSIEATSKGMELVAKTARIASKGADSIASTMEKASETAKKVGRKLKD